MPHLVHILHLRFVSILHSSPTIPISHLGWKGFKNCFWCWLSSSEKFPSDRSKLRHPHFCVLHFGPKVLSYILGRRFILHFRPKVHSYILGPYLYLLSTFFSSTNVDTTVNVVKRGFDRVVRIPILDSKIGIRSHSIYSIVSRGPASNLKAPIRRIFSLSHSSSKSLHCMYPSASWSPLFFARLK